MYFETVLTDNQSLSDFVPIFFGAHTCDPGHKFGPYTREHFLIHFVLEGCGTLQDKFGTHTVKKGEIFIIRPDEITVYQADAKTPWKYVWIYFSGTQASLFDTDRSVYPCPIDILEKAAALASDHCPFALAYASVLSDLAYRSLRRTEEMDSPLAKIKAHLDFNYMKEIKVEDVAKEFGFDRSYLFKLFKRNYGCGIKEYVQSVRMDRAKVLLKKGFNVSTTAQMVGFQDEFNFSKAFKKRFGISPKDFKKS